jgi:DNA-binding CsgD family transcriptional regulator
VPLVKEAAAVYRALGDRAGLPYPLLLQAIIAEDRGDFAAAEPLLDEARGLFEEAVNPSFLAMTLYHEGVVAYGRGDLDGAADACERSLRLSRAVDDRYGIAAALIQVGLIACDRREFETAAPALDEAMRLYRESDDQDGLARGLATFAVLALARGRPKTAARLFGAVEARLRLIGNRFAEPELSRYERAERETASALGPARFDELANEGERWSLDALLEDADQTDAEIVESSPAKGVAANPASAMLTPRELEVVRLVAGGMSDREIGAALGISHSTAARHLANVFGKLGVNSRTAVAAYAFRHDLV